MKTLKTTLGLFLLSAFLFSFTPQPVTENNNSDEELVQLQDTYGFSEEITHGQERKKESQ